MKKLGIISLIVLLLVTSFSFSMNVYATCDNPSYDSWDTDHQYPICPDDYEKAQERQEQYENCPLGLEVTKDLSGALRIFKILAPILCIAFSTIEAVKAVTAGDAATDMKKIAIRFAKRMVYTILIFFLAVIVDAAMQLFNIWDADGECKLDTSTSIVIPE